MTRQRKYNHKIEVDNRQNPGKILSAFHDCCSSRSGGTGRRARFRA
jgi:hypothetical protein